ncbi:MAG: type 4a pilus biogenesis protein PilO [Candidatus Aminicenantes bacterium]|nr:type 4a pilus biogenesis protein PilO [Candidatus Aminicenantes bacterium]
MKETFDSLSQKEMKVLRIFSALLILVLLVMAFMALKERNAYSRSLSSLSSKQREFQEFDRGRRQEEKEWQRWEKALRDIEELEASYFYDDQKEPNQLRLDLRKIFRKSRMNVSRIKYTYAQLDIEKIKKVSISFNISGSYFSMKRFINSVEKLPRFLMVEKIDFLDTSADGNFLTLKMSLAGYYAF